MFRRRKPKSTAEILQEAGFTFCRVGDIELSLKEHQHIIDMIELTPPDELVGMLIRYRLSLEKASV